MINKDTKQFPVVVTTGDNKFEMYIPDLHVTIEGSDYVELYARASVCASAIVYYHREHNFSMNIKTTYEEITAMCKSKNQFPTYLATI